ncbi:MAG: hypothetical protein ACFFB4_03355 [Promethearchaeota archaeon]
MDFGKYDLFPTLKKLVLEDPSSEVRRLAIKILHEKYPKKGEMIIKIAIRNEDYFDIPIIISGERKRYNINDLISYSIEKMKYGDKMVNEIFNTELINFLLDWKHYRDKFHIYYDIRLQCYILIDKLNQKVNYLCSNNRDLFSNLKTSMEIRFERIKQDYTSTFYIFNNTFHTSKMRIVNLSQREDENYPTIKIIDEVSNISCYL